MKPSQGLHPFSVIEHPTTGEKYLVAKNFMDSDGNFVNHSIVSISQTTSYGSRETRIYAREIKEGMGMGDMRGELYISARAQSFKQVFGDILRVNVIGYIREGTKIAHTFSGNYASENGERTSSFMERNVQRVLEGKGGRLAPSHQEDDEIIPTVQPPASTEDATPTAAEPKPAAPAKRTINLGGITIPPRGGNATTTANRQPSTGNTSKPTIVNNLASLGELFANKSLETKLNPADFTLLQAIERVGYNLSDLTMHVIAGETIMGSSNPQWILKDSAPQNSPFRGQTLNLQDVFDLFANENISEKDISRSINFAGPKVASEITAMIRDPQFRSQFDIK